MTSRSLLGTLILLGACGGGLLYTTLTATPAAGPDDAIDCVRSQLKQLQYDPVAYDATDHRVVARKIDNSVSRPEPQFRRIINRLEIQARAGAEGKTELTVGAHTLAEYSTHRGPTETEEKASEDVNQAAQAVVQACGQP